MIASAMVDHRFLASSGQDYLLTGDGEAFCRQLGVDVQELMTKRRMLACRCLDWSERKPHLAGALGTAVADVAFERSWIKRTNRQRIVRVTDRGKSAFADLLCVSI